MVLIPLESTLRAVSADLTECGVAFALVGGLAVSVRTEPRFTRDADLAVALSDDAAAEDINRLREYGYSIAAVLEQTAVGRLATVRLERPGAGQAPVVDLPFASSGIEGEIVSAAEEIEILPGFSIRVARTGHLVALKLLSRDDVERPQDIADLRALPHLAAPEETRAGARFDRAHHAARFQPQSLALNGSRGPAQP